MPDRRSLGHTEVFSTGLTCPIESFSWLWLLETASHLPVNQVEDDERGNVK